MRSTTLFCLPNLLLHATQGLGGPASFERLCFRASYYSCAAVRG